METVRTFSIGAVVVAALSLYSQITTRTLHRNLKRALFLVFTLHFSVLAYCQTYPYVRHDVLPKDHVYLREPPGMDQPVTDTVGSGPVNTLYMIDNSDPKWVKVEIIKTIVVDEYKRIQDYEAVFVPRYAERASFEAATACEYKVTEGKEILLRERPNIQSKVADTLKSNVVFQVMGPRSRQWVEVGVTKYVHKYNRRGKITGVDKVDYTYYMTQKDFSSGTYANEVDLSDYEPDLIEKFGVIQEKITKTVTRTIGRHIDSEVWFPWLVLGGIVLYFLLSLLLTNTPRLALAVKYLILTFVFLIEVVYIALLGNGFWFCEPEQVGWLKAILFTLVTLGVVFVEFNLFFSLLAEMKTESRDFNTSIGVILFTVIALVMFVYALFSGGLSDEENMWLIYALLGTQVLQVIISAVQLRRYPLFALMVILFIPLGTFAILLTALSVFKFLVFFAIIGLVLGGIANGRTGRPKSGYGSEGWELAKTCPHYIPSGSGCRLKHGEGCSLVYNGKCEFGRM